MSTSTGTILSKRALESTVIVDDTQIIVLGGLIQDQLTDGSDKVPLFGDIPIAGALFRYDARQRDEDEPDDLHQADGVCARAPTGARSPRSATSTCGASRSGRRRPPRLFWSDPTQPHAAARRARCPARPGADVTPPLLGDKLEPPPPAARAAPPRGALKPLARMAAASPPASPSAAGFAHRIPYAFARTHGVLAQGEEGGQIVVLTRPDATVEGIAELKRVLQRPLANARRRRRALRRGARARLQRRGNRASRRFATISSRDGDLARLMQDLPPADDLLDSGAQAPVIRMINALLLQALRERASDVHFEPYESRSVVRFRVDGVLRDVLEPPRALHGGARLARQDHGEPRHRRKAAAAGRTPRAQARRQAGRRPRVDAADGTGRARRAAPARQGFGAARPDRARHERRDARRGGPPDPRAARHRARHRPDGLRQDDDAVRGAVAASARHAQHDDGRGSRSSTRSTASARRRSIRRSSSTSRARSARSCARIPTSS